MRLVVRLVVLYFLLERVGLAYLAFDPSMQLMCRTGMGANLKGYKNGERGALSK